jgi:hypothetical protein
MHDIVAGEQLNVGVVVYSPKAKYLAALCRPTYLRLSQAVPGIKGESFKATSRFIQTEIERFAERMWSGEANNAVSLSDIVTKVLPRDESAFQWSEEAFGVAADLSKTLDELYERLVTRYDDRVQAVRRTDEDVWRQYKTDLEKRRVLKFLKTKVIATATDEVEFRHAWKNGAWHCLEPASFDLSRSDSIRDKAHKILGQMVRLKEAREQFKVYLLVGRPRNEGMQAVYERTLRNLESKSEDLQIIREDDAQEFVEKFARQISEHEKDHVFDKVC